jgi:hypothetical protein
MNENLSTNEIIINNLYYSYVISNTNRTYPHIQYGF